MIIDCISDLHGYYPNLEGGDLLIVAGDLTARDSLIQHSDVLEWLHKQPYEKKVVIAGNHDNFLQNNPNFYSKTEIDYLCDSGTEFEGLKIWGSPWSAQFPGINPHCCAFTMPFGCDNEDWLSEKWEQIPLDTDILITHSPSYGNHDWVKGRNGKWGPSVGSLTLWMKCLEVRPKLHVFGHIHEAYGHSKHTNGIELVNASHVNEEYKPVNKPIRIILQTGETGGIPGGG